MTTITTGNKFENLASDHYIWAVTSIDGETVNMESKNHDDDQILKASMSIEELQQMIEGGFFCPVP